MNKFLLFALAFIFSMNDADAQTLTVSTFTTGLNRPVSITNSGLPNDNRIFVCEKVGRIRIINRNTGVMNVTPFLNITSLVYSSGNEQGLLGLAFHPDYANNGYFYIFYNHRAGSTDYTRLVRYQVSAFADTAMINSAKVMMTVYHPFSNHNGGNLMFGKDGYLYVSMGDGGSGGDPANRAQNCDSLLGKILRLDVGNPNPPYYFSPASNPFYGGNIPPQPYLGTVPGRDEIYAWGLRNPWRCSIDRLTGDKWIGDVGQSNWEEIDFELRSDSFGHNYGWRCYEGNASYSAGGCQPAASYTAPIHVYPQGSDCSVTGGFVYRGGKEGSMFGKYFFADYCSGKIWKTQPNGSGWTTNLVPQTNSLFTFKFTAWGEDSYGELYLAGDGTAGVIYKIVDTSCAPTAYIDAPDTIFNCSGNAININAIVGTGLNYNWFVDSISVFNSSSGSYSYPYNPGCHKVHVQVTGVCSATSNTIIVCSGAVLFPSVGTTVTNATICAGASTSISGTGATTYTWQPGAMSGTTITVTPASTTTYTVTGTNANGCVNTATRTITVNPSPSVGTTVTNATICAGASTSLTGTGATTYTWQPGAMSGTTVTVTPVSTTTYTVTGTNANGCVNTATRTITVNPLPTVSANAASVTICTGDSTTITGTGATSYTWAPGSSSGSSITVLPVSTTTFTVTGTNANGCVNTATITITVIPCISTLNLKLFIEGYYSGAGFMTSVLQNQGVVGATSSMTDSITVQLRNSTAPYAVVSMIKTILNTDGTAVCSFPVSGTFYIAVSHRNGLQTWSATALALSGTPLTYDFSDAITKAYGSNQSSLGGGVFGFFSGDLNADENVDLNDLSNLENDISNFANGYLASDINGDGNVDILDTPIVETNVSNFVFSVLP